METRSSKILRMLKLPQNKYAKKADPVGTPSTKKRGSTKLKVLSDIVIQERRTTKIPAIASTSKDSVTAHQLHSNSDLNYDSISEDKSLLSDIVIREGQTTQIPAIASTSTDSVTAHQLHSNSDLNYDSFSEDKPALSHIAIQEAQTTQIPGIASTSTDSVTAHQLHSNSDLNYDSFSEDKSVLSDIAIQEAQITQIPAIANTSTDSVTTHQLHSTSDLNYDSFSEDKSSGSEYLPTDDSTINKLTTDEESFTSNRETSYFKNDEMGTTICPNNTTTKNREKSNDLNQKPVLQECTTNNVAAEAPDLSSTLHQAPSVTKNKNRKDKIVAARNNVTAEAPSLSSTLHQAPSVSENKNCKVKIVAARKLDGKRIRNKGHFCYFCHKIILNFAQHLEVMHHSESEVGKLLAMPKNSKIRREGFGSLIRAGDFYHNIEVLSTSKGELILVRRPTEHEARVNKYKDYGPCPHCLGFMLKKHLWHHIKNSCTTKRNKLLDSEIMKNNRLVIAESNAILNDTFGAEFSNDFVTHISSKLRDDDVGEYCKNDNLILKFGAMQFEKYGTTQCPLIRQSMRQLSRFTLKLREMDKCGSRSLSDYLRPEKFDMVVQATKLLCVSHQSNVKRPEFEVPSLALKIGYALKKCAAIKRGTCLKAGNLQGNEILQSFLTLMELEWSIRISSNALNTLKNRKINATQLLPITSDLIKLSKYIDENMRASRDILMKSTTTQNWTHLASLCLSKIILFNKRRSGEASRMTMENYLTRPNWADQCTEELKESLTDFEKTLATQLAVVDIIGKRGRRVPVLLTSQIQMAIEVLIKTRGEVNVSKNNSYLFARTGESVEYMRGHDCLKKSCHAAQLEHPENISSTKLRKYIATVCQVFNMTENEYDWLARHLGHDIRVHRDFYRLHESAVELTKVSRLLIAVDQGEVSTFAGKKLEDINLAEFPNLEEEEETSDDEEVQKMELENDIFEALHEPPMRPKRKAQSSATRQAQSSGSGKVPSSATGQARSSATGQTRSSAGRAKSSAAGTRRSVVKRPWSLKEKEAVLTHFKRDIQNGRLPGKAMCTECIEKNPSVLSERNWTDVKYCVKNQIDKIKKLKA